MGAALSDKHGMVSPAVVYTPGWLCGVRAQPFALRQEWGKCRVGTKGEGEGGSVSCQYLSESSSLLSWVCGVRVHISPYARSGGDAEADLQHTQELSHVPPASTAPHTHSNEGLIH